MHLLSDEVGSFLRLCLRQRFCIILIVGLTYISSFQHVTCAVDSSARNITERNITRVPQANLTDRQRQRTVTFEINVRGLNAAQIARVNREIQRQLLAYLKRRQSTTTASWVTSATIVSSTTEMPSSASPTTDVVTTIADTSTAFETIAPPVHGDIISKRKRKRRSHEEDYKDLLPEIDQTRIRNKRNTPQFNYAEDNLPGVDYGPAICDILPYSFFINGTDFDLLEEDELRRLLLDATNYVKDYEPVLNQMGASIVNVYYALSNVTSKPPKDLTPYSTTEADTNKEPATILVYYIRIPVLMLLAVIVLLFIFIYLCLKKTLIKKHKVAAMEDGLPIFNPTTKAKPLEVLSRRGPLTPNGQPVFIDASSVCIVPYEQLRNE